MSMYGIDAEETAEVLEQDPGHQPAADLIRQMAARIADLEAKEGAGEATARLLGCGWCYEEQGEEVHPHPECPIRGTAASVVVPAADRAALRDRTAEEHRLELSLALGLGTGAPWDAIHDRVTELGLPPLDQDPVARRLGLLDEYRAKILTEAADAVFALDYDVMVGEEGDENLGSMREAWDLGTIHADKLLRRMAAGSPAVDRVAAETEAHPPEHTWAAELHDPLADEWVPGTRYTVRDRAVNALTHAKRLGPTWADGTPTERRLVRATTTYTVEEPDTPAVEAQPGKDTETP